MCFSKPENLSQRLQFQQTRQPSTVPRASTHTRLWRQRRCGQGPTPANAGTPEPQIPQHHLGASPLSAESKRKGFPKAAHRTSRTEVLWIAFRNLILLIRYFVFRIHNKCTYEKQYFHWRCSPQVLSCEHPDPTPLSGSSSSPVQSSPRCSAQAKAEALSRESGAQPRLAGRAVSSVCGRRGGLASKAAQAQHRPQSASPGGHTEAQPGGTTRPGICLFWTNSFSTLPQSGSGSAGPAHLTAPRAAAEPRRPRCPSASPRPSGESGEAAPGAPGPLQRGPTPTGRRRDECQGRPTGPRRPYPQDVVALGAAAGDVDALRGAHGRKRAATGTWHGALPPPGAGRALRRPRGATAARSRLPPPGGRVRRRHVRGGGTGGATQKS